MLTGDTGVPGPEKKSAQPSLIFEDLGLKALRPSFRMRGNMPSPSHCYCFPAVFSIFARLQKEKLAGLDEIRQLQPS